MYYVYFDRPDLAIVSRLGPQTRRAEEDCLFAGTAEEVREWAASRPYSLVWR